MNNEINFLIYVFVVVVNKFKIGLFHLKINYVFYKFKISKIWLTLYLVIYFNNILLNLFKLHNLLNLYKKWLFWIDVILFILKIS